MGHLEHRWAQLESLILQKIQDSAQTLEDLSRVETQLRDAREWVEEQRPALTSALRASPPPDLAQSFLFDHLSVCVELEARQQLLGQAVNEAQAVASRLGLSEKKCLQELVEQAQMEVEVLGTRVAQRRKYLSKVSIWHLKLNANETLIAPLRTSDLLLIKLFLKAFTERTQFLQGVGRALSWVKQQERKALLEDHISLLPEDLTKQVAACRSVQSSLRAYQRELASLWVQGRELERDASDKERAETLARLEELQSAFETALQRTTQHLAGLEKALTSRKYFQIDLDKTCHWLRRAEVITFPEINFNSVEESSDLLNHMSNYQSVLEQASEYENLLLIVQRIGQEILPTLNEVDHCYLDERLNALPQQYNAILALAKEKKDRVQQIIQERKEFSTLFEITRNALEELQEQFDNLEKQTINITESGVPLINEYKTIDESLVHLGTAVGELHGKSQGFLIRCFQSKTEEMQQLVILHSKLKRRNYQKMKHLSDCLEKVDEHNRVVSKLNSEIHSVKEGLLRVKSNKELSSLDKIANLYLLLGSLEGVRSQVEESYTHTKNLDIKFDTASFQETKLQLKLLQSLQSDIKSLIKESETRVTKKENFSKEAERMSDWLKAVEKKLKEPLIISEVKAERINEEKQKLKITEEEVRSRLKLVDVLGVREREKCESKREAVSVKIGEKVQELEKLGEKVQQGVCAKQVTILFWLNLLLTYFYGSNVQHSMYHINQSFKPGLQFN